MVTKEQWDQIEESLTDLFGRVELLCDGYKVIANMERFKMKLVVVVYVDGRVNGEWFFNESNSEIPRKFHMEKKRYVYSMKMRAWYIRQSNSRIWTKEERTEFAIEAKRTITYWQPYFTNAKAFCRQIRKTCASIEVVRI